MRQVDVHSAVSRLTGAIVGAVLGALLGLVGWVAVSLSNLDFQLTWLWALSGVGALLGALAGAMAPRMMEAILDILTFFVDW